MPLKYNSQVFALYFLPFFPAPFPLPAAAPFLAGAFLAEAFLAGAFLAGAFLAGAFLVGAFLAGAFFAAVFLAGAFFAAVFLAGAFLAGAFLVATLAIFARDGESSSSSVAADRFPFPFPFPTCKIDELEKVHLRGCIDKINWTDLLSLPVDETLFDYRPHM